MSGAPADEDTKHAEAYRLMPAVRDDYERRVMVEFAYRVWEAAEEYHGIRPSTAPANAVIVHKCCGCSCYVCVAEHSGGRHTAECEQRLLAECGWAALYYEE
jgi:hypothetical protein